jgi:amphi-Trp domain-containing protein
MKGEDIMAQADSFLYESIEDAKTIQRFIEALREGIEKGKIKLSSNGDEIVLKPGNLLKLSVKARKKGGTEKLSLKIAWKDQKKVNVETNNKMKIST